MGRKLQILRRTTDFGIITDLDIPCLSEKSAYKSLKGEITQALNCSYVSANIDFSFRKFQIFETYSREKTCCENVCVLHISSPYSKLLKLIRYGAFLKSECWK
jgi:hypothetical protein